MGIAGWKTQAMLLRYLGSPEDRMRSAFSTTDRFRNLKERRSLVAATLWGYRL
jgi:hypothetical protein